MAARMRAARAPQSRQNKDTPMLNRSCHLAGLLQGGADLRAVQELLGHADVRSTQIYTKLDRQHLLQLHRDCHPRSGAAG